MNNNSTGSFKGVPSTVSKNNGEGNPSSLSAVTAVNRADNKNEQMANLQNQKASAPQGRNASDYNAGKGLGSTKNSSNDSLKSGRDGSKTLDNNSSSNSKNNSKMARSLHQAKMMIAKEGIKAAGTSVGIPAPVTEKVLETKKGQQLLDKAVSGKSPNPSDLKKMAKPSSEKSIDEKSDEKEQEKISSGEINFEFSLKTIKWLVILTPVLSIVAFFLLIVVSALNDEKVSSMVIAGMVSESDGKKLISEATGQGSSNNYAVGMGNSKYPKEYYDRISSLGNVYSSQKDCEGDECLSRSEFLYYLKVADLALRYKNKYHVDLDWYLLSATNLYFDNSTEDTMEANLGGYNKDTVEDYNTMSGLDWDNDYKNMSGYQYLDADDSQYDLQILAKNMVKKKTTQTCTDGNGNVTAKQEDEDVEDKYFAVGAEKRLSCGSGQTYNINSTYTKDLDKYDEFMLEYIDKKMYSYGSGKKSSSNNCVITNNSYVWPIGSMETTVIDGKEHALGEPATVTITSYFGSTESFRISGHGAIDIAGVSEVGKVPVIAAKAGTVIYPTDASQTQFADNGHYGSKDGGGYGNYVIIQHDNDTYTLYGHLAQNSITVKAGDTVSQGQVIGKLGHSGSSTGPHLHFEMRVGENSSANRVDPLKYVDPKNPRPSSYASSACSAGNNMSEAFVNLALEQLNDPSASGGEKYRKYMCSGCGYYAWCAAFVSWVINNAEYNGQKMSDIIQYKSTWVYEFVNYFYSSSDPNINFKYNDNCSKFTGKNGSGTYTPKQGDLIFFDWDEVWDGYLPMSASTFRADHIGIVQKVEGGDIITIEGNASNSVREKSYSVNSCQVLGFGSWY